MKIIFTNGCFDVLHVGHVKLLEHCYNLAYKTTGGPGKVVVGLNSDDSVKRLKGETRPVNNQHNRRYVLQSLKYVDEVEIFDEDTPYQLITEVKPYIIVKGGDYDGTVTDPNDPKYVVGSDLAVVDIFSIVEGYSTTNTLEKIKQ
tara:strand:+ start:205 stop:639 length:435 start_codon:yes stop_codon:yes gene_type:complete